jgi:superfamily II DNA/RNA helicase
MALQPRTPAPGKARRAAAAKAGKPANKTTAQKESASRRYADIDPRTVSKKEARNLERSKLRAKRYAESKVSKPRAEKPVDGNTEVPVFERSRSSKPTSGKSRTSAPRSSDTRSSSPRNDRGARPSTGRPDRNTSERKASDRPSFDRPRAERPASDRARNDRPRNDAPRSEKPAFKKTFTDKREKPETRATKFVAERATRPDRNPAPVRNTETSRNADTVPSTRRDAAKARANRSNDGRPNFEPRKREKYVPGVGKRSENAARDFKRSEDRTNSYNRPERTSSAYGRTHSATTDFGADDNYISANLADANLIDATPKTAITMTFAELGIAPKLVERLTAQGINHPFPIQIATLPDALAGNDILGRGQTGSGKTLAFGLAMLTNLNGRVAKPHKPLGLVLTPTRELAQQIDEVLTPLAKSIGLDSVVIAGGMPYGKQITAMRQSCPILVATPGRLIDLLDKGEVQLDDLQITVLDEADQMADMGFLPVVKEILDQAKPDGQRLLFSATLDRGVDALVKKYLNNPKTHSLQNDRASVSTMKHYVLTMQTTDKDDVTAQIASRSGKTILFVKTQRGADRLADKLAHAGVPVGALHGGKSQAVRTRTLALFKETPNAALVATDVAARGIHVDGISLVVHFDAPTDHKDYLHRSGRTARAGEEGNVVLLSTTKSQSGVKSLTSRAGVTPIFVHVEPMSNELIQITGAVEPSGIPYVAPVMENKGPSRGNRRPRPNSNERRRRPR